MSPDVACEARRGVGAGNIPSDRRKIHRRLSPTYLVEGTSGPQLFGRRTTIQHINTESQELTAPRRSGAPLGHEAAQFDSVKSSMKRRTTGNEGESG